MSTYTSSYTGAQIDNAVKNANLMLVTAATDPDTSTVGTLGQLYQNTVSGDVFRLTNIAGAVYTWKKLIDEDDIVNDLTTGGATVPLSAEQGKELETNKVAVTLEVNGKALSGNVTLGATDIEIEDSEELYETTNVEGALAEVRNLVSTKVSLEPIATYMHSTNKEIVVSNVDVATGIFTSAAHGLANGNQIYPIINIDAGNIYPINVYPTGLVVAPYTGYYVVNKTDDTFQISATSGGAALTFTTNTNMDLTKWHFETAAATVVISDLSLTKCKVIIKGRALASAQFKYCIPNYTSLAQEWLIEGTNAYEYPAFGTIAGDIYIYADITIDYSNMLTLKIDAFFVKSNNTTTNIGTTLKKTLSSPKYRSGTITSLWLYNSWIANGTVMEVYKI